MAILTMHVQTDTAKLDRAAESSKYIAQHALADLTRDAVGIAKGYSRWRTGAMFYGWTRRWTGTRSWGTFGDGVTIMNTRARFAPNEKNPDMVPVYNEFGTRYMSAQPMLRPAMAYIARNLSSRVSRYFDMAINSGLGPVGAIS